MFASAGTTRAKGRPVLLRAWPEIHRRTGARLRVVGADPLMVRLALSRAGVASEGIDALGFLSQDDLTEELSTAKALVAPSLGGESFGMVLTRAFACAAPVVASSGYRDVMTDETVVPPGEPDAVADAIVALLEDEPRRERFGRLRPTACPGAVLLGRHRGRLAENHRALAEPAYPGVRRGSGSWPSCLRRGRGRALWWRGPDWHGSGMHSMPSVGTGCSDRSRSLRGAFAWRTVINQAIEPPHPRFMLVSRPSRRSVPEAPRSRTARPRRPRRRA